MSDTALPDHVSDYLSAADNRLLPSAARPDPGEDKRIDDVLRFWFGDPPAGAGLSGSAGLGRGILFGYPRQEWFSKAPAFDEALISNYSALATIAAADMLRPWRSIRRGRLALCLLLDQFPRNIHRNTPGAFKSDPLAREVADQALAEGDDQRLPSVCRWFLYLPFEHSEDLADQERAVALFESLPADAPNRSIVVDYAQRHYEVIKRFGRFPHRNAILGRASTEEEASFLEQPGSSF